MREEGFSFEQDLAVDDGVHIEMPKTEIIQNDAYVSTYDKALDARWKESESSGITAPNWTLAPISIDAPQPEVDSVLSSPELVAHTEQLPLTNEIPPPLVGGEGVGVVPENIQEIEKFTEEQVATATLEVENFVSSGANEVALAEEAIALPDSDIQEVRERTGILGKLEQIRNQASVLLVKLRDKTTEIVGREIAALTTKPQKKFDHEKENEYERIKGFIRNYERENVAPVIEEAKRMRNKILEERGLLQMSQEDYQTYFAPKDFEVGAELNQGNVGDCYAVAALHALSCSPNYEIICRSSMKKLPDGSWEVKIPLLSENGDVINITQEELGPQKNAQFLKVKEGDIMPDLRYSLKSLGGKEGIRVLEAAFIKKKFGSVDRLAAEGGWGSEVLESLGGDNFKKYSINSNKYNADRKTHEHPGLVSLPADEMAFLDHVLENFDPEVFIATAATRFMDTKTLSGQVLEGIGVYKGKDTMQVFVPGHAYSISGVDKKNRVIKLANPWDTTKSIELTFDQFKGTFGGLDAVRIDNAKLLSNMSNIAKSGA